MISVSRESREGDAVGYHRAQSGTIPLRRSGAPEDVSAVVEFLAGDLAGYVTGENIRVGGGIHLV